MDPATVISLAVTGLNLVEQLLPVIERLKLSGEITAEQQQAVRNRYESLKTRAEGQFNGPHWAHTGRA